MYLLAIFIYTFIKLENTNNVSFIKADLEKDKNVPSFCSPDLIRFPLLKDFPRKENIINLKMSFLVGKRKAVHTCI